LANPQTWINAATQIFFSLGLGFGSLIAFSSYNHHNNDFEKQAVIISLINSGTSVFASIVTFSIYGFKATFNYEKITLKRIYILKYRNKILKSKNSESIEGDPIIIKYRFTVVTTNYILLYDMININTMAVEGTGLAFIVYSEAIKNMPLSQLWSVLYFIMLLLLGMGSMLGNVTAIITPLADIKLLSRLVCLLCLLLGFGFTSRSGNYWFTIFNEYAATLSLLFIVFLEVISVCYVYGLRRFERDIEDMLGHRPNWYWKVMWAVVSPLLLFSLFIFYIINYIQGGTPTYQAWDKDLHLKCI
uniref:Solute carrier family 6 member 20 n=1 Tax=Sinocyclocheilus grahami TaxID=75366 RepID=A0A672PJ14_SINGR